MTITALTLNLFLNADLAAFNPGSDGVSNVFNPACPIRLVRPHMRPSVAAQEPGAANNVARQLYQRPSHNSPRPAYSSSAKDPADGGFASLLQKRTFHPSFSAPPPSSGCSVDLDTADPSEPTLTSRSHTSPSDIANPPQADSTWIYRSAGNEPRGPTPAYENRRDTTCRLTH
ncbi:hypothetical protein F4782DRAFT_535097 [Xylaria castorea]|nr:hypothetical protein F4782DRAFT_535097 [Xylaria castorea]